jgi:acyl-CoA thioesterase FadM
LSVDKLGRTSIRYVFKVFVDGDQTALEGTMTIVSLQDGKAAEIPAKLREALSADMFYKA